MKQYQNYESPEDGFPLEMKEIKSGKIFELPDGYFDDLEKNILGRTVNQKPDDERKSDGRKGVLRSLGWISSAAAAVLFILFIGDFILERGSKEVESVSDLEIIEYLNDSDLDIEEILEVMGDETISSMGFGTGNNDVYYNYINENISEFEELLY